MTIGLFEATKTTSQALANNLTKLLNQYGWGKKSLFMSKMKGQIWISWLLFWNLL
jgi:hypothetical protein